MATKALFIYSCYPAAFLGSTVTEEKPSAREGPGRGNRKTNPPTPTHRQRPLRHARHAQGTRFGVCTRISWSDASIYPTCFGSSWRGASAGGVRGGAGRKGESTVRWERVKIYIRLARCRCSAQSPATLAAGAMQCDLMVGRSIFTLPCVTSSSRGEATWHEVHMRGSAWRSAAARVGIGRAAQRSVDSPAARGPSVRSIFYHGRPINGRFTL